LEDTEVCEGLAISVPYSTANFIQVVDFVLVLQYDPSQLSFTGLENVPAELEADIQEIENGNEIEVRWNNEQAVTLQDGEAFRFTFESINPATSTLTWRENRCHMTNVFGYSPTLVFNDADIQVNPLALAPESAHADPDSLSIMDQVEIELFAEGGSGDELVWMENSCEGDVLGEGSPFSIPRPTETTDYFARWQNGCGPSDCQKVTVVVSQEYDIYAPDAFTPNGDGLNDRFFLVSPADLYEFRLQVFDRWGQLLFESNDVFQGWDGRINGTLSPPGVYAWKASYRLRREGPGSESRSKSGTVVLVN
jgi:gliding motility-associated-like protein